MALLTVGIGLSAVALSLPTASAAPSKKAICHATGNGSYHLISVSVAAAQKHLAHGDALPGEEIPGMVGYVFGEKCEPVYMEPESATLTIRKSTDVDSDTTFSFNLDANLSQACELGEAILLRNGEDFSCSYDATADDWFLFEITESDASGFTLASIDCGASVLASKDSITTDPGTSSVAFDLDPGDKADCTFNNVRDTGTIVIKKVALGGDGSFTFFGFPASFSESCPVATIGAPDYLDITCENVPTTTGDTTYHVTEAEGPGSLGFSLTNVECDDSNSNGNVLARRAEIKLEKDETVTCTFTNVRDTGTISIVQRYSTFSEQAFNFTSDLAFENYCSPDSHPLDGFMLDWRTDTETCNYVPTWQVFTVTQSPTVGWTLERIACEGFASFQYYGATVEIRLLQNFATATCTFTNTPITPP